MKTRTWLLLGAAAVAALLVWLAVSHFSSSVEVETAEVKTGRASEYIDERAKTRLPETYLVAMPISGRIAPITLAEGTPVRAGQEVARIVQRDLDLAIQMANAAVGQLDASIEENRDDALEQLALRQVTEYVNAMANTVMAAEKRLESGEKNLDYAVSDLQRKVDLRQSNAVSVDELERAELDKVVAEVGLAQDHLVLAITKSMDVAARILPEMIEQMIDDKRLTGAVLEEQLAQAKVRLEQVELDQQRGTIASPVDGVVLTRYVSSEQPLAAGTPLLEIGRLEELEVEVDVLSLDVVKVKPGQEVKIYGPAIGTCPTGGRDHANGTVEKVYPAGFTKISSLGVEEQRVKVIIGIDPEDVAWLLRERKLGVGYRVRVKIETAEKAEVPVVPRSALFRGTGGGWQVFAVRNDRAEITDVEVGLINDDAAEITAGLSAGERVVLAPESSLTDGARVSAQ